MNPKRVSKALAAGLGGLLGAFATAQVDGAITQAEWVGIITAALLAAVITYAAPKNAESAAQ